ncbi:MAG: FAD-dependent oxidoreductase [Propionibacteriaceae bacterium]|jgi:electron transfer flavoprotein-quinone oxidoreductase|nr:FAD-dependent oxidoreductase [Propionibacteriaceae bacterium]
MADEPDFDVIVIGAGVAGTVTAYLLAQQGLSVVLIERGEAPGSKNFSGGIMYCTAMKSVFPNFLDEAPVERLIDRNEIVFLNADSWVGIDYGDRRLAKAGTAVTVLRAHVDAWLAEQAEAAGAMVMPGVKVDALLKEGSRIVGVKAGEDELRARVVVAADGVNSFIARDAGLRPKPATDQQALGVKALFKLDRAVIEDRFGLDGNRGVAYSLVGDCSQGVGGGGFVYTNKETLSVGLVLRLDDLVKKGKRSTDVFDHFLEHPLVDAMVRGGELIEYGSHLVNEGGEKMMGQIVFDGLVLVGDASGLTLNTGLTVRGMDLATGAAIAAAKGIAEAIAKGDTSATGLAAYKRELDASFVGQDMHTYAKAPHFLENERMYGQYGQLMADVLHEVFCLDTTPRKHLLPTARGVLKQSGIKLTRLGKDGMEGVRAL